MAKGRAHKNDIPVITRRFDAPRELVFSAFTDPQHLMRWWGPKGFQIAYCKLDMRLGGMIHYCARSLDGELLWGKFEFTEILGSKRIVLIHTFSDTIDKIVLTEEDGKTLLHFTKDVTYADTFDQLENYLQHEYR